MFITSLKAQDTICPKNAQERIEFNIMMGKILGLGLVGTSTLAVVLIPYVPLSPLVAPLVIVSSLATIAQVALEIRCIRRNKKLLNCLNK